jgi:hypothetical protein
MPPQLPNLRNPGIKAPNVRQSAKSVVSHLGPPVTPQEAIQLGKERAHSALSRLKSGVGPQAQGFLETLVSGGEEGQELARQIAVRVQEEMDTRRRLCAPLSELLAPFRAPDTKVKFLRDVVVPARTRQATSQQTADRIDRFFPLIGGILRFAESRLGPLTFGIGLSAEGGAGFGLEASVGVAGLRHHCLCLFDTATTAIGTYAEAQGSVAIGVAEGVPEAGYLSGWEGLGRGQWPGGLGIDGSLSVAYGVAAEGTISLQPVKIQRPSFDRPYVVEYKCVGLGLSLGVGAPGGGVSLGLTRTRSVTLAGKAR